MLIILAVPNPTCISVRFHSFFSIYFSLSICFCSFSSSFSSFGFRLTNWCCSCHGDFSPWCSLLLFLDIIHTFTHTSHMSQSNQVIKIVLWIYFTCDKYEVQTKVGAQIQVCSDAVCWCTLKHIAKLNILKIINTHLMLSLLDICRALSLNISLCGMCVSLLYSTASVSSNLLLPVVDQSNEAVFHVCLGVSVCWCLFTVCLFPSACLLHCGIISETVLVTMLHSHCGFMQYMTNQAFLYFSQSCLLWF